MKCQFKITPDELAALVPGSKVVKIPGQWFKRLKSVPNVFEQFYHYLISMGCEGLSDLHSRACVGNSLQKDLVRSERNRLRKKYKTKKALDEALWWIDVGSGPMESFGEHKIVGDAVCVFPIGDYEQEAERNLVKRVIEALNKEQVYFIQIGVSGPIKIGYTATSVESRLRELQTACPDPLRVLGAINGTREIEKELHKQFAQHRKSGEWFEPHPEIINFIQDPELE